jgi:hypothetical protein
MPLPRSGAPTPPACHVRRPARRSPPAAPAVGAGVLSLPFAFRCAGWAGGLVLTFSMAAAEAFTLYVLARYAESTNSNSYSSLVRPPRAPHRRGGGLCVHALRAASAQPAVGPAASAPPAPPPADSQDARPGR